MTAQIEHLIDELVEAAKQAGASDERGGWGPGREETAELAAKLKAEVAKLASAALWQPIETAPKDGSLFIGWERSEGFCVTRYGPTERTSYLWESSEGYPRCPSHWMPLPEPPANALAIGSD